MKSVPVGISNHHAHLSKEDMVKLFGKENLEVFKEIRQPGQFAAKETVNLIGKGVIWNVRVVGPLRKETQVEIMRRDQKILGVRAPILVSPGIIIQGPKGAVKIDKGVIIAKIHVHLSADEAREFGLENDDKVDVYYNNKLIFNDVVIRSGDAHKSHFHIDREEAQLFKLKNNDLVELRY